MTEGMTARGLRRIGPRAVVTAAVAATIVAAALAPLPAGAQGRPDSLRMSCGQASSLVRSRGAIVIGTGPHIYDRFVADRRFCSINETNAPAFLATRDTPRCFVGYQCKPVQDVWPFGWD